MAANWEREDLRCKARGARRIPIPATGESERVSLEAVLARDVWFADPGVYVLREAEAAMYVGVTQRPLRERLCLAIDAGQRWTLGGNYREWTVAMQRLAYRDELPLEKAEIARLTPKFNIMGRPRKLKAARQVCAHCGQLLPKAYDELPAGGRS